MVELVAVMVLAGILAAVAVPAVGSISSTRAAAVQRQVQRDLSYARERAVSTGRGTWVTFSPVANTYAILQEPLGSPGRANAITVVDPATGRGFVNEVGDLTPGVALLGASFDGGAEVGFDWKGRPVVTSGSSLSAAGVVTITGSRTVTVQPGTGHSTIP